MEFKRSKTTFIGIISSIIALGFFLWFSLRPALFGAFNWHRAIGWAYLFLCVTAVLPLIFLIIYLIKKTKNTDRLLKIFSVFSGSLWILIFAGLTILTSIPVNKDGLNLIKTDSELPVSKSVKEGEPIARYAISSDPHWGAGSSDDEARKNIMKTIDKQNFDAFFCLGDISQAGMIQSIYKKAVDDIRDNLKSTPYFIMAGNHDSVVNGLCAYKRIFMPDADKMYFRLDNGKIHFIFLYMLWDDTEFSKSQEKWLIKQLEEIPQEETVVVFSHCYVTGSGYWDDAANKHWGDIPDVINTLCPIFEKYNVDLSLSGHNHFFESLSKENVEYMILGSMGGKLDQNLIYKSPYSQWIDNENFGYADMSVYEDYIYLKVCDQNGNELFAKEVKTK